MKLTNLTHQNADYIFDNAFYSKLLIEQDMYDVRYQIAPIVRYHFVFPSEFHNMYNVAISSIKDQVNETN
jgi:hypothetical protein